MFDTSDSKAGPNQLLVYQIRVKGHLGTQWADWFEGLAVTLEESGDTSIVGPVADQAALYGLLKKVRDLGLTLISVVLVDTGPTDAVNPQSKPKPCKR